MAAIQCLRPCPNKLPKKKRLLTSPLFLPLRREETASAAMKWTKTNESTTKLTLALASDAKCRKQTKE